NVCTDDACRPETGCVHTANAAPCDDANACTTHDTCSGGKCVGGAPPTCDDGNVCTDDACRPDTGCVHSPNAASCDDGDACTTGDTCLGGSCTGALLSCDDGNPCTDDSCDSRTGCAHTLNTGPCDDGDFCTTGDVCEAGACVGKPSPPCPLVASTVEADVTVSLARPTTNSGAYRVLSARGGRFPKRAFLRLDVAGVGSRRVSSVRLRLVAGRRSDSGGR